MFGWQAASAGTLDSLPFATVLVGLTYAGAEVGNSNTFAVALAALVGVTVVLVLGLASASKYAADGKPFPLLRGTIRVATFFARP